MAERDKLVPRALPRSRWISGHYHAFFGFRRMEISVFRRAAMGMEIIRDGKFAKAVAKNHDGEKGFCNL